MSDLVLTRTLAAGERPNIVYFFADDLGYGDVQCLNPRGKIHTPHMDRLAAGRSTPGPAQTNDSQIVLRKPTPAN